MAKNKWQLHIGCHRNTLTSRDSEMREFDTEEEAMKSYQASKETWHNIGYKVWFASLTTPDGEETRLEQNPCRGEK